MIVVSGTAEVQPDKRQQAIELFRRLTNETVKEDGNISYHFYIDIDKENVFRVFEQWQSQEALDAHFTTDHMAELNRELPKLIAAPPELTRYEIADSAPLPL
ncbi:putative quinol monooxygenase [Salinisphaera aquimarina]|uniref:Quinol monooxygenase n=1 Tax=Salinisphaera aquimarina TaxID=2094031 RepID=A0ABV7ERV5_9GAMM